MSRVMIMGTGITHFAKSGTATVRSLAEEAVEAALADAGLQPADISAAFFSNGVAGLMTGQEMVRGQMALRNIGLDGVPVVNVENACASGSTALHLAATAIRAGQYEAVLVVGAEKLSDSGNPRRSTDAIASAVDIERIAELEAEVYGSESPPEGRSLFMDIYAGLAREYMARSGATEQDFAAVAVKNRRHAALNPYAQFRKPIDVGEVLNSRRISGPLTLLMCSPIGDGAAAVIVTSERFARSRSAPTVEIRASAMASGLGGGQLSPAERAAHQAFELAAIGPTEIDVFEVHDAAAPAELIVYEELGLCGPGGGAELLASGATTIGGTRPVNTSGGLLSRGHPIGATGCAQIVELCDQLRGRANARQVSGARIALAENAGGHIGPHGACAVVTLLSV